ncbi:MAG TPA: agmatinase family protein [Phycisphaerales bacterium]|nr:agmatinase family protein [Phycisphaerales bacterium]
MTFDPDAAVAPGAGVFGLPTAREDARIVLIPVPFEATTSYGGGTERGPEAIRAASAQVDLHDRRFGPVWRQGIFMEDEDARFRLWGREAREHARRIIERGGAGPGDEEAVGKVDTAGSQMNALVAERVFAALDEGRVPGVIGGEHSVSYGAIRACAERWGDIGVLQIDAHMDLRDRFEGFRWSHASVMFNVLEDEQRVKRVVQVGIRDFGEREEEYANRRAGDERRVIVHYDDDLFDRLAAGRSFAKRCRRIVEALPERVYVTFDIDGLDPGLCPHTGTPVPGGLSWREVSLLLGTLAASGRQFVGFDLVEVAPGPEGDQWDANVGARVLYRLCGLVGQSAAR